jgi:hypothetical protein
LSRGALALLLGLSAVSLLPPPAWTAPCPNEAFRGGSSAHLSDCRAYELVTPPDTNGRLIGTVNTFQTPPRSAGLPIEHVSPSRDSVVFFAYSSPLFSPGEATGLTDVYEAERQAGGWLTTRRISPAGKDSVMPVPGGISPDHRYATVNVGGAISPMALGGETDYLLNPDGSHELTGLGSLADEPFAQSRWISEGGEHVIFSTGASEPQSVWCFRTGSNCKVNKLEPEAPPTGTAAVYDRSADGPTKVVSLLPGEVTPAAGEHAFYKGASRDGTSVAFTIKGTLYVRVDNAVTLAVAPEEPTYAGLSDDGRYLFYVAGGNIHRFDTSTEEDDQVNSSGDGQVMNVSADGSHVYFISPSQLDGVKGTAGQPNVYVWSGGLPEYVATVAPSDLMQTSGDGGEVPALARWTSFVTNPNGENGPAASSTRTTPDGTVLVFESRAQLTPYDNDGHTAIYRYDDGDKSLACVSCNPLAEPATADARLQELTLTGLTTVIHNVTVDGSRVFFETQEALVGPDTDGVNDVYQWTSEGEEAVGVHLISSGKSLEYPAPVGGELEYIPTPNVLLAVSREGEDVVFLSQDVLVPGAGEGGTQAIYNARVNGGLPIPLAPPVCNEEGCRPPPASAPSLLAPQSEATLGGGNVKPRKSKPRCRRGANGKKPKRCSKKKAAKRRAARASASVKGQSAGPSMPASSPADQPAPSSQSETSAPSAVLAAGLFEEFGIESVAAKASTTAAGMHPDLTTEISLNHFINEKTGAPESNARTEEVTVALPPGLLGNPNALPRCKTGAMVAFANCPIDSQVGVATVLATLLGGEATVPIFNLEPPHPKEEIARLGFYAGVYPVFIDVKVRTAGDYGVTATVHSAPGLTAIVGAETTFWGNPAASIHDEQRMTAVEAIQCGTGTACKAPGGKRPSGLPPTAFLSNSSACQAQQVGFAVKSYQLPGQVFSATAPMAPVTACEGLPFNPSFEAQPTTRVAGAPTGLKTTLTLPQASTEAVDSPSTATMREARVTLPEGMTIAAGAADGLEACSEEQVGYKQEVDAQCPDGSKLGTATITSPALAEPIQGEVFQRTPRPGHLFGLWLVSDDLGLHVKLPGEIEPNKATGQLTAAFSDLPQVPVEQISLNIWGGPRAPLQNPTTCGTYSTAYAFAPHSRDPAVSGQSQMTIDEGCGGGGFSPKLRAGVTNPTAGAFSPMVVDISRGDGEQNLGALEITLPKGELAKLAGVGLCPDAQAAAGACPAASKIGSLTAAVGPGPQPLWLPQPGKSPTAVYLAGPYKGAPFSIVTSVPAQAGPFDLGVVAVRSALEVDPETAQATVKTDPLPQFIEGVAAVYRRVHVVVDRPGFSLNPTNCSELAVTSKMTSTKGAVASPSARFQVDGCRALKFKPKLTLDLKGGTDRGDYPALSATVKARKGDANIGRVSVALPRSEFLAQEHIQTICTRKRFAADNCPKRSIYGRAKAWTPLLDKPLQGPVYLRSSDNPLPDLVMALGGELDIALVGRIDSKNGGIRTTFDSVPDAPITKFVLKMRGGKKSLLVNSQNICRGTHRAVVRMRAQNGRILNVNPALRSSGCVRKKK